MKEIAGGTSGFRSLEGPNGGKVLRPACRCHGYGMGKGGSGWSAKATTDAAASLSISLLEGWREVLADCCGGWDGGGEESVCDPLAALLISLLHQFKIFPVVFPPFRITPAFIYLGRGGEWKISLEGRRAEVGFRSLECPNGGKSFASKVSLPWLRDRERGWCGSAKATTDAAAFYQSPCSEDGVRGAG
ncbi:hypothetical protein CDAR_185201 [Caerostris darwini]|uniref:Uncharacterized protein n=1 Tax=Caerostris darwini TaxID=1538125 RepID=A0AAV4STD3_9ARAC|nr:hypothetical protein CDAR_185201 [Caerostris darwini]